MTRQTHPASRIPAEPAELGERQLDTATGGFSWGARGEAVRRGGGAAPAPEDKPDDRIIVVC